MITLRRHRRIIVLLAFRQCIAAALPAQMPVSERRKIDSAFAVAMDKANPDSVRLYAFNFASFTVYKDVAYGLKITAAYVQAAREMNRPEYEMAAWSSMGMAYLSLGKLDSAEYCFMHELEMAEEYNDLRKKGDAQANMGLLFEARGNLDSALIMHNKSLKNAVDNNFVTQHSRAKINIGHIYELQGKYVESMKTFQDALDLGMKVNATGYYPSIYISLGEVNEDIGEDTTAARYYRLALHWANRNSNHGKRIQSLQKIGGLFEKTGTYDSALVYFTQAYDLAKAQGLIAHRANSACGMGRIYNLNNNTDKAWGYVQESIHLYESSGIIPGSDEAFLLAGEIEFNRGHAEESIALLKKSHTLATTSNDIRNIAKASRLLAEAERTRGNDKMALLWMSEYDSLNSIISNQENVRSVIRLKLDREFREQKFSDSLRSADEIRKLDEEYKQTEERQRRNFYFSMIGSGVLLVLLAIGVVVARKFRKINTELSQRNIDIEQALKDKEVLLREVHHRVKNNMQVVSSLLELKSRNTSDPKSKEVLLDSQARLASMQIAHQKMYQGNDFEKLEVVGYCRELCMLLMKGIGPDAIDWTVKGSALDVHVEQVQALGFILHELITNTMKYAWVGHELNRKMWISFSTSGEEIEMKYADNGKGFSPDFVIGKTESFGIRLIHSLVERQLMGTIQSLPGKGVHIIIRFKSRQTT